MCIVSNADGKVEASDEDSEAKPNEAGSEGGSSESSQKRLIAQPVGMKYRMEKSETRAHIATPRKNNVRRNSITKVLYCIFFII